MAHVWQNWRHGNSDLCERRQQFTEEQVLPRGVGEKVFLLLYFVLWVREGYKGGGMIWKGWEMSGIGTHDMQSPFPKKQ